jgi:hypothetical protein
MRKLYRKYVPTSVQAKLAEYAKAAVTAVGSAAQAVNLIVPAYSDEAQVIVGVALAVATFLGVKRVPNRR